MIYRKLPPRLVADLIGKPYCEDGRGPEQYDCAGLAVEMQRRQGRVMAIPSTPASEFQRFMSIVQVLAFQWVQLDEPRPGCIVFFPTEAHVGTMIDESRFLHTESDKVGGAGAAVVESLHLSRWRSVRHSFHEPVVQG